MRLPTLILGIGLLAAGCSGPGGRPVTEELTLDEINGLLKKEPDYNTTIVIAESFRENASTLDKAKANDLTYDRLKKFLDSYYNADVHYRLQTEGEEKWLAAGYGETFRQAEGLIARWQQFLDENKPDSYVKVELTGILPAESRYGTARVMLAITPLKGAVDKVEGSYGLFPQSRKIRFSSFGSSNNNFSLPEGLRTPVQHLTWLTYSIWDIKDGDIPYNMFPERPGLPLKELLEKYAFDYTVTKLVKGGKEIRFTDIYERIPASIRGYWEAGENEREERMEYYYTQIVRELADPEFIPLSDFLAGYEQEYFRELDPLAAWLMYDRF